MADLQAWFDGLSVRPGETQDRLAALEQRVATLETEIQKLRHQLETLPVVKKKAPPCPTEETPTNLTHLSDFCVQHFIPYQAAADLFPHMIRGQYITIQRRKQAVIGPKGRHDFWVQMHIRPDFRACDDCPHEECGQSV
jgi:hypothetical protein